MKANNVSSAASRRSNANVRNAIFAPSFVGPAIVGLALVASYGLDTHPSAWLVRAAVLVYVLGGFRLTLAINVPMNEAPGRRRDPDRGWGRA